jgi:DNA processing protein
VRTRKRQTIEPTDERYPAVLRALAPAPDLHVEGAAEHLWKVPRRVTVVGSRQCSPEGEAFAHALAGELAKAGFLVVSGGADGIDSAAHRGAIEAGGLTAVVLGMGLGAASGVHPLWSPVLAGGGALVSPFDDEEKHQRARYFLRNELMALLGEVTVVIERQVRSGAANTTAHARRHGRVVLAVPQAPWSVGRGCIEELLLGAKPVRDPADVLAALGHLPPSLPEPQVPTRPPKRAKRAAVAAAVAFPQPTRAEVASLVAGLEEVERSIVLALTDKARSLGELCDRLPAEPAALAVALFALECRGFIHNRFGFYSLGGPLAGAGPVLAALTTEGGGCAVGATSSASSGAR